MGFTALIRTLLARKLILGWAAFVGAAAGLSTGLVLPKIYESSAKVLVDSIQKDMVTGLYEPRLRVSEFLGQQAAIAGSRAVALETFNALADEGFIASSDFETRWRSETGGEFVAGNDSRLWAADELVKNLVVTADALEGTLSLAYRGENASQAARVANGFAAAYMKTVQDQRQRRAARSAASFSEERQTLERDIEGAQRELNQFRESAGIVAIGEYKLEGAEMELTTLTAHIADARAELTAAQSLLNQARSAPRDGLLTLSLPESAVSGRQAQARLGSAAEQLQRLNERFGDRYPDYQEVKHEKVSLEAQVLQAIVDHADFSARRLAGLEDEAAIKKAEVVKLHKVKETYDVLENKVDASRDTYALIANRTLQEAMQSRVDDLDVVLLSRAVPPTEALTPPLAIIALIGLAIGAVLGASGAVALEFAEGRIRDPAAISHLLRTPVLAEIAISTPVAAKHTTRKRAMRARAARRNLRRAA